MLILGVNLFIKSVFLAKVREKINTMPLKNVDVLEGK